MWFVKVHWLLIWLSDIQVNQNQRADISLGICYGDGPNYIKKQHLPLSVLVALKESTDDSRVVLLLQHHCQSNMSLWYRCYVLEPWHVSLQLTNILVQMLVQMLMNHCRHVGGYRGLPTPYITGRSGFIILSQLKISPNPKPSGSTHPSEIQGTFYSLGDLLQIPPYPPPLEARRGESSTSWADPLLPPCIRRSKKFFKLGQRDDRTWSAMQGCGGFACAACSLPVHTSPPTYLGHSLYIYRLTCFLLLFFYLFIHWNRR